MEDAKSGKSCKKEKIAMNTRLSFHRDIIKYFAMFAMLLNHISYIFMEAGTFWAELFTDIGYFIAITMCYFLVEGFEYTHSRKEYGKRLLVFAVVSQLPYCLAHTKGKILNITEMNMIFTLLLCFFILCVLKYVKLKEWKYSLIFLLVMVSLISDWALLAPVFTLLFAWAKGNAKKMKIAFTAATCLFGTFNFLGGIGRFPLNANVVYAFGSMIGVIFAGIVLLYFYNGKRAEKGQKFSKWFFFCFYPVHLLVLGVIRVLFFL